MRVVVRVPRMAVLTGVPRRSGDKRIKEGGG